MWIIQGQSGTPQAPLQPNLKSTPSTEMPTDVTVIPGHPTHRPGSLPATETLPDPGELPAVTRKRPGESTTISSTPTAVITSTDAEMKDTNTCESKNLKNGSATQVDLATAAATTNVQANPS